MYSEPSVTERACELLAPHLAKPRTADDALSTTDSVPLRSPPVWPMVSHESNFRTAILLTSTGLIPPNNAPPVPVYWNAAGSVSTLPDFACPYIEKTLRPNALIFGPSFSAARHCTWSRTVVL